MEKRKLVIACPATCSLSPTKIGEEKAEILRVLRENGAGSNIFARRGAEVVGRPLNLSSVTRHFAHYRLAENEPPPVDEKASDLAIIDSIIVAGYRNSRNWKPTIKETLDAMRLKLQLTGSSAFSDMLDQMDAALDERDGVAEAPDALFSEAERPTDDAADLAAPD